MTDVERELIEAAVELCPSESAWDDPRMRYVEVQIDKPDLARFRAAVQDYLKEQHDRIKRRD